MTRIELNLTELNALIYIINKELKVFKNVSRCKSLMKVQDKINEAYDNTHLNIDIECKISEEK